MLENHSHIVTKFATMKLHININTCYLPWPFWKILFLIYVFGLWYEQREGAMFELSSCCPIVRNNQTFDRKTKNINFATFENINLSIQVWSLSYETTSAILTFLGNLWCCRWYMPKIFSTEKILYKIYINIKGVDYFPHILNTLSASSMLT